MKKIIINIIFLLIINNNLNAFTSNESLLTKGSNLEFYGGYSLLTGYYSTQLENGLNGGVNFISPFRFVNRYFLMEGGLGINRWALSGSSGSFLSTYYARAGGIFYYPMSNNLKPYGGVSVSGSMVHLKTEKLGKEEITYKPGIVFRGGFFGPSFSGFGTRMGVEQEIIEVSGKKLRPVTFSASVFMNFHVLTYREEKNQHDSKIEVELKISRIFKTGVTELDNGNIGESKKHFENILVLDKYHRGALSYMKRIKQYENSFRLADKLISDKDYYRAIPVLVELNPYMKTAGTRLLKIREQLSLSIPDIEKEGIKAYEQRDYDRCIVHMEKILLIDPENRVAKIYLPRSMKRKKALESLR